MSSSNLVRVTLIEETVYGETPAGNFKTMRFTSEGLSGTPDTTESQQIRTDRMSSGQIVVGLTVGGETSHELAKEEVLDLLIASAMNSDWATTGLVSEDMDINNTAKTLDRGAGDFIAEGLKVGDLLTLGGFVNTGNNTQVMVTKLVSATQIEYVGPDGMGDEIGVGTSYKLNDKIEIGISQKSFSMQKEFTDLTDKAIVYKGMIVSTMALSASYGNIVTCNFGFSGNYYAPVDVANEFITDGRTIDAPATTNSLNGSIDMPFLITSDGAVVGEAQFCIQSLEINLNNNLTPQTCIGEAAPKSYNLGTALPEVTMSAYLDNQNFGYLKKKLTQESVSVGFLVRNSGGYYAVFMPAVQLSFDDPSSAGQNQDVIMSMSGVAKVGDNNEKSMAIYRS